MNLFTITFDDENNKKYRQFDTYAYGDGHLRTRDSNARQVKVPDPRELKRNRSWILTLDTDNVLTLWELSGLSLIVRKTPKFTMLSKAYFPKRFTIPTKGNTCFFATCRLESELSHLDNPDFEGRPSLISLIFQNNRTHSLTTADIVINKTYDNPVTILAMLNGHSHDIKFIRIHDNYPYIMTIDNHKKAFFWHFDDTDV